MSKTISECFFALIVAVALGAAAASEAHAQNYGSGDFNVNGIRQANQVNTGVVVDVVRSQLYVEPNAGSRIAGAVIGGAACGVATRNAGSWYVQGAAMTACGAIAERVVTAATTGNRQAVEIIVKLDNGTVLSIAQEGNASSYWRGQRVYLIRGHGADRVVRAS